MKKIFILILILLISYSFIFSSQIMNLNQIKPGMVGKGKTVLKGNRVEEFGVEIIGILKNFAPKKDLILGKIKSPIFEKTGVIAGMSGSPVYIDGKIIGAIAYSFPFSKEAIAGITPIQDMVNLSIKEEPKGSLSINFFPIEKSFMKKNIDEIYKSLFSGVYSLNSESITPAIIPVIFRGFSPSVVDKYKSLFTNIGLKPVIGGSFQKAQFPSATLKSFELKEGEPVAVQLITGDFEVSAVGTVTYVNGSKVFAFGHPFFNLGTVEYSMARAEVLTVVPSIESSFKISNTGDLVGKFTQDRFSGLSGEIGKMPYLIPLNIEIRKEGGKSKIFHLKFVNDKILTPLLIGLALENSIINIGREFGNLSLRINGDIYLENGKSVHIDDLFSGNLNSSLQDFSGLTVAIVYYLINNQFKDIKIHKIDMKILCEEDLNIAYMEKVLIDKFEAKAGESLKIAIYSRTSKGKIIENKVNLVVPYLPAGTKFNILIGDAESLFQMESRQFRERYFVPQSLEQLIRILNNLRKNNRIYFKLYTSKRGIFLRGQEMPNLPPSIQNMFLSPRSSSTPSITSFSTIKEYQLPVPFVYKGSTTIPIKVKE